jgi:hypothetical protein
VGNVLLTLVFVAFIGIILLEKIIQPGAILAAAVAGK